MLTALIFHYSLAQSKKYDLTKDKRWTYINGEQRAINDTNRVNYLCEPFANIVRVTDFNNLKLIDFNDTQIVQLHLNANQVYEKQKTVTGPSFFISKYEVTNQEYRAFVEDCIQNWMKENRPEIAKIYTFESVEYLNAVVSWLGYLDTTKISKSPIATWKDLGVKNLNWNKIQYNGVSIFPKTEVWAKVSPLLYNEPMRDYYFTHPSYNNYPVTCVSVKQAQMYCKWYTEKHPVISNSKIQSKIVEYRLPTELEWERAASVVAEKPSKTSSGSPVNNNFLRNSKGNYIANFKPSHNDFINHPYFQTSVESFFPNDAGCYNMQGNVAELTMTPVTANISESLEPKPEIPSYIVNSWNDFKNQKTIKGHIVKGGAWNLPEAACTIGSRTLIQDDEAKSYVGFRMVGVQLQKFKPLICPEF